MKGHILLKRGEMTYSRGSDLKLGHYFSKQIQVEGTQLVFICSQ